MSKIAMTIPAMAPLPSPSDLLPDMAGPVFTQT